jgi:hypothetical protein
LVLIRITRAVRESQGDAGKLPKALIQQEVGDASRHLVLLLDEIQEGKLKSERAPRSSGSSDILP